MLRLLVLLVLLLPVAAAAQSFPDRPIHLVVGFPPGGSNDVVARILAPRLGELLGTSVIVDNRPGANATIGTEYVARAAPDGYTLTLGSASPLAISPHTYPNIPYDTLRDFTPITAVAMTPEVVAVNPNLPARTLPELVSLAQQREIDLGSSGNGGLPHLAIELFRKLAGPRVTHIPYRGAAAAVTDAVGGQIGGTIMDLPAVLTMVRDSRLRALAVTAERRSDVLPGVPTAAELGLPSLVAVNWFAVMAPPRLPQPIADRLFGALTQLSAEPAIRAAYAAVGIEPMRMNSREQFAAFLRGEVERWGAVARESGARAE